MELDSTHMFAIQPVGHDSADELCDIHLEGLRVSRARKILQIGNLVKRINIGAQGAKTWALPLVSLPAFAMESVPGPACLSLLVNVDSLHHSAFSITHKFSSANFAP